MFVSRQSTFNRSTNNIPPAIEPPVKGTMKWGEPIWNGLHVLAEKIRPEYFFMMKPDLIEIIRNICHLLPCPDCSNHATKYLSNINFNLVRTKEDLAEVLFHFHNSVSERKGLPIFPHELLKPTYAAKHFTTTIHKMIIAFLDRSGVNTRQLTNQMGRDRIVSGLRAWLNNNIDKFEP